jgi:peptidylprolyl isomerase
MIRVHLTCIFYSPLFQEKLMRKVENGDMVKVCYTGKLEDGKVFDKTESCQPMEFKVGAGEVIPGFESAVLGMAQQEKKTFTISPDDAYGVRDERLKRTILRSNFPTDFTPQVGDIIALSTPKGEQLPAVIDQMDDENITIDFNHPLAGKSLTFELEVAEINGQSEASTSKCASGCCCS